MILTSKNLPAGPLPPPEKETDKGPSAAPNVESTPPVAVTPPEGDDMKEVFVLDNAPVAEPGRKAIHSKPGIYLTDGGEMTIEVVDGRYTLEEEDPGRRQMLKESLIKAGFRSAVVFPDEPDDSKEIDPKKVKARAKARAKLGHMIELAHPDNAPGNLINAKIRAAGKRVKVEDGIAKTDEPRVIEALQKKGFIVQNPHTLEREMDPDEPHPPLQTPDGYPVGNEPQEPDVPQEPDEREDAEEPIAPDVDGEEGPDGTDD